MGVKVRGECRGIGSLLLPLCRAWGLNSSHQPDRTSDFTCPLRHHAGLVSFFKIPIFLKKIFSVHASLCVNECIFPPETRGVGSLEVEWQTLISLWGWEQNVGPL